MSDRPILFSAPMVCALLAGTKTQTRRIMKPQPLHLTGSGRRVYADADFKKAWAHLPGMDESLDPYVDFPYGRPGDRLWVRESFCQKMDDSSRFVYNAAGNLDPTCFWYAADGTEVRADDGDGYTRLRKDGSEASPWKPSIHMPRAASRITLEITEIRVERLQEISCADAIAEGITASANSETIDCATANPRDEYRSLWESINGPGSWDLNPWVWALTFKRTI